MFNEYMSRQAIRGPDEQFEEDICQIYKLDVDTSNIYLKAQVARKMTMVFSML